MALSSKSRRRGLMAEINVVPYIDVMLVLVVILMVARPLCESERRQPAIGQQSVEST